MREFYDITLTLSSDLPNWPGAQMPQFKHKAISVDGNAVQVSKMEMSVHTGTHVDAPRHFIEGGKTIEEIPLEPLIGPAQVIELTGSSDITKEILAKADIPKGTKRLLLKTENSQAWDNPTFKENYISIQQDGAKYLVELGIELVGVDYLSVAPFHNLAPTHRTLLEANIVIVEGLNLANVPPGSYTLYCLPLKIRNADGAPARALLTRLP